MDGGPLVTRDEIDKAVGKAAVDHEGLRTKYKLQPVNVYQYLAKELNATQMKVHLDSKLGWQYSKPFPDWAVRQRARQDLMKMLGMMSEESGSPVTVNLVAALRELEEKRSVKVEEQLAIEIIEDDLK